MLDDNKTTTKSDFNNDSARPIYKTMNSIFMMMRYLAIIIGSLLIAPNLFARSVEVQSPDGQIAASFEVRDGSLFYSISKGENPIIGSSKIEILANAKTELVSLSTGVNDTSWEPVWGQFSTIRDNHSELTLSVTVDDMPAKLICRVFDTGVGFRFELPEQFKGKKLTFLNEYKPLEGLKSYAGPVGKELFKQNKQTKKKSKGPRAQVPIVTERADGLHLAFLESDLYSAADFELMTVKVAEIDRSFTASSSAVSREGRAGDCLADDPDR